jgi:hypothetical protein
MSDERRYRIRLGRSALREQDFRSVTLWVPDVQTPEFAAEARRQSLVVAWSPHEAEDQAFVDAASWHRRDEED